MAILNRGGARSQTRSGPGRQLRGQLIFGKIKVWSQNGPTGAAGDVMCLSWQAPVAVTPACMIGALSPAAQDMAELPAGGGGLRAGQRGARPAPSPWLG